MLRARTEGTRPTLPDMYSMPLLLIAYVGAPVRSSAFGEGHSRHAHLRVWPDRRGRFVGRHNLLSRACACVSACGARAARTSGSGRRTSSSHHGSAALALNT